MLERWRSFAEFTTQLVGMLDIAVNGAPAVARHVYRYEGAVVSGELIYADGDPALIAGKLSRAKLTAMFVADARLVMLDAFGACSRNTWSR